MECFQCGSAYNEGAHCPRLLINCGHSICQKCLTEDFDQGIIACPECQTLNKSNSISDFPKNLALLHIKPTPLDERQVNHPLKGGSYAELRKDPTTMCQKHKKKIEGLFNIILYSMNFIAFCENDRQLLCITCILEEGYKNQDICSLQDV